MRLADVLASPVLAAGDLLSPGDPEAVVRGLAVGDAAGEVSQAERDSVFVLTRAGAGAVRTFRLDALMARAAHAGVRLVVLPVRFDRLPRPHRELAGRVAVVAVGPEPAIGDLLVSLTRRLGEGDGRAVDRLRAAAAVLARADGSDAVLAGLSVGGLGASLVSATAEAPPGAWTAAADEGRRWLVTSSDLPEDLARMLLLAATGRLLAAQARAGSPDLATLLSELVSGDAAGRHELRSRALALGFDPDAWHLAVAIDVDAADLDRARLEETVRRVLLGRLRAESESWTWTHRGTSLLVVRSWVRAPDDQRLAEAVGAAHAALRTLRETLPAPAVVRAGRSAVHQHVEGLRLAVTHARAAARVAGAHHLDRVAVFDEHGIGQALVDWHLSEGAALMSARLAPLTSLPARRREPLVQTLRVYLDHQSSVTETARTLFLHRNAVRYRIDQIKALLGTDLSDPDERLALQLACRSLLLGPDLDPRQRSR